MSVTTSGTAEYRLDSAWEKARGYGNAHDDQRGNRRTRRTTLILRSPRASALIVWLGLFDGNDIPGCGMRLLLVPALEAKPFRAVYEVRAGLSAVRRDGDGEHGGNGRPSAARYACSGAGFMENGCERVGPFLVSDHVSTAGKRPACIPLDGTAQPAQADCSMLTQGRVPYRFPGAIAAPGYALNAPEK